MMRTYLAWALVACGPVTTSTEPTPAETVGRRGVEAIRVAMVEMCRATTPGPDAHVAHRLAWALACSSPAVGVSPAPPASPSEVSR